MDCEIFETNEFVAACYKIQCKTPYSGEGKHNNAWRYLYADSNNNKKFDVNDELIFSIKDGDKLFVGCNEWHKGVIMKDAPEVNGFVTLGKPGKRKKYSSVFWWNEPLDGAEYDYHVMIPGKENYESNPNAS